MSVVVPNHLEFIKVRIKCRHMTLRQVSIRLGRSPGYLHRALQQPDLPIGLLLQLSDILNENLLDQYVQALDPNLRPMSSERNLQQAHSDMMLKLMQVTEERDRYWEALKGKAS